MKCTYCKGEVKPNCDWNQGRCPHIPAPADTFLVRFHNLIECIKGIFKR